MNAEATRVLVVEDNPGDAVLMRTYLREADPDAYQIEHVERLQAALERLTSGGIDVVLLDLGLPDSSGIDTFLQAHERAPGVPVVVLTGLDDEALALRAVKEGAQDYLVKGRVDGFSLHRSVRHAMERHRLLTVLTQTSLDLKASEARFRFLVQNSSDVISILEADGTVRYMSPSVEQHLGHRPEELIGRSLLDFTYPGDEAPVRAAFDEGFRSGGEPKPVELRLRGRNGRWHVLDSVCKSVVDPWGAGRLVVNSRDVTEARRNASRLAAQDAATRLLSESASLEEAAPRLLRSLCERLGFDVGGMWLVDRQAAVLRCIEVWHDPSLDLAEFEAESRKRTFACREGMPGRVWSAAGPVWIADVLADPNFPRAAVAARAGLRCAVGFPILVRGEVQGVVDFFSREIAEPDADLLRMMVSAGSQVGEFVEHRRAEAALRESEERFRRLAENAPDLIYRYRFQPAPGFEYVSPAATAITGYTPEEHYADPGLGLRLIHPEDRHMIDALLHEETLSDQPLTLRWLHKDGAVAWTEQRNVAIRDGEGRIVAIEGIARDVTERKLLEDQLRQVQKMEAVGQLAGGVAHDFNNLLTVISGYGEMLLAREGLAAAARREVEEIGKAAARAAALTRQLLAFSRRQVLEPRILELNGVVADTERMLGRLIGEDIDLVTALDPALGRTRADPGQIEQVLMNLAINARDAMPEGGKLTIDTRNVRLDQEYAQRHHGAEPGEYVMLAVSDTGVGMSAATLAHVFEPFFTTKPRDRGTGLGLSMVFGIVKQSGGHVHAYSEPGRGTTFKIYLPRVFDPAEAAAPRAPENRSLRGEETILVLEDDAGVRALICQVLKLYGYTVLEAASPAAALALATGLDCPVHLLLTDVVMPGMNGPAAAASLQARFPGLRVLYASGYTDNAIVHRGVLDPGTPFLQKPFTVEALALKVREVLDAPGA